jgi:anti-sigma-K factor RskA
VSDIDIHQLAGAYALDAVDERERADFEAHYPTCPVCQPEIVGFRESLAQVASSVAMPPPASLKANVMTEIGMTRQLSPLASRSVVDLTDHRDRRSRSLRIVVAAAAVILLATGAFVVGRQAGTEGGFAAEASGVMEQPDTRTSALTVTGTGTGTFGVVWSPSSQKAIVMGDSLPDPGPGKVYELWLVDDSGAHAVRLLDKADGRQVRRVVTVDGSPTQWAVTVEPEDGVDAPTGDVIFAGAA